MRKPLSVQQFLKATVVWEAQHFTPAELFYSQMAEANGLTNLPTPVEYNHVLRLAVFVLDPIRELWGAPVLIYPTGSGFREPQVNAYAGGEGTSDHQAQRGAAADIRPADATDQRCRELYRLIWENSGPRGRGLEIDQCILYEGRIHVGTRFDESRGEFRIQRGGRWPLLTEAEILAMPKHKR